MITMNLLHSKAIWLGIFPSIISYLGWSLKRLHKKVDAAASKSEVEHLIKLNHLSLDAKVHYANEKLDRLLVLNERTSTKS